VDTKKQKKRMCSVCEKEPATHGYFCHGCLDDEIDGQSAEDIAAAVEFYDRLQEKST